MLLLLAVSFVGFPAIIIAAMANEPHVRLGRLMQTLGLLSFPLYAIHFPVLRIVTAIGDRVAAPPAVTRIIAVLASLGAAWCAARFYDQRVRDRLTQIARRQRRG